MINYRTEKVIDCADWDKLVRETYDRPYHFQQQDGCKERGQEYITVPTEVVRDFENDTLEITDKPYNEVEGTGVSLKGWLARDPKDNPWKNHIIPDAMLSLFWERHFYPSISALANDLYEKGLIEAGDYTIDIDW